MNKVAQPAETESLFFRSNQKYFLERMTTLSGFSAFQQKRISKLTPRFRFLFLAEQAKRSVKPSLNGGNLSLRDETSAACSRF